MTNIVHVCFEEIILSWFGSSSCLLGVLSLLWVLNLFFVHNLLYVGKAINRNIEATAGAEVAVDSLQIIYFEIASLAMERLFNFCVEFLIVLFWRHFFLRPKTTLSAVQVVVHAMHGVVLDATGNADELVLLLFIELSIICLWVGLEFVSKSALG